MWVQNIAHNAIKKPSEKKKKERFKFVDYHKIHSILRRENITAPFAS